VCEPRYKGGCPRNGPRRRSPSLRNFGHSSRTMMVISKIYSRPFSISLLSFFSSSFLLSRSLALSLSRSLVMCDLPNASQASSFLSSFFFFPFSFLFPSSMRNQVGRLSSAFPPFIYLALAFVTVNSEHVGGLKSLRKLIAILIPRERGGAAGE